jgi:hypothetical protein
MGPMVTTVLQALVCLVFVLLGIDTANKPPITEKARWVYRVIFMVLGGLLLTLSYLRDQEAKANALKELQKIRTASGASGQESEQSTVDRTILQQTFERQSAVIQSNQFELQAKYQELLNELATNSALAPGIHERIIITKARLDRIESQANDLKNWEERLRGGLEEARAVGQIRGEKDSGDAQSTKAKVLPYFDAAVKSLAVLSEKAALLKGDKSVVLFQGLPQNLSAAARAGKRSQVEAGEIKFQTNTDWDFKINFAEELSPEYQADMGIACKGGVLHLRSDWDTIETEVDVSSGETLRHGGATGDGAKKNIADALDKLLAAELVAMDAKK